jgi:hypothetical protein
MRELAELGIDRIAGDFIIVGTGDGLGEVHTGLEQLPSMPRRIPMQYLLNSAVLTTFGDWRYTPLTVDQARAWLTTCVCDHSSGQVDGETCRTCQGTGYPWHSTIRYPETAAGLEDMAALPAGTIPVNPQTITMEPGDTALVFRLVFPQGFRPDPALKGHLGREFVAQHSEVGLLTRLS